jgi:Fe2+ transport system protein FeoA
MNVFDLSEGSSAEIIKVNVQNSARERLLQLGIKEGACVDVLGFSLFSSSVLLGVGYTRVALRRELAKLLEVKCLTSPQKDAKNCKHPLICGINLSAIFNCKRKCKAKCRHKTKLSKKHRVKNKQVGSKILLAKSQKINVTREK